MFGQVDKRFLLSIIIVSLLAPVILMIWNLHFGATVLLFGAMIAFRGLRLLHAKQLEGLLPDQRAPYAQPNHAQTIFVQLIDDDGTDLPPEMAQAKLAAAQMRAGPLDMVVGVRRKVA